MGLSLSSLTLNDSSTKDSPSSNDPCQESKIFSDEYESNQGSDGNKGTTAEMEQDDSEPDESEEWDLQKQEAKFPLKLYFQKRKREDDSEDEDDEYKVPDEDSSDDESTISEQEKAEGDQDYAAELNELKEEDALSLDQLMAKYGVMEISGEEQVPDNNVSGPESSLKLCA